MSTPEINDSESRFSNRERRICWGPDDCWDSSIPTESFSYSRQRPASVSNPVRPDRTRGPAPFHHYWWASSPLVGTYRAKQDTTTVVAQGPWATMPNRDDLLGWGYSSALYDRAVMSYLTNLKNSKVNLGVALAEARKTAELLAGTSNAISRSVENFMNRNWKALGKMASWKKLPAKYLELSYGWTPLLNDVWGSAEALSHMVELGYDLSFTARGSAKDVDVRWSVGAAIDTGQPVVYTGELDERQYFSGVHVMPNNLLPVFSSLGLTNPLEVAWELVPYSFVLDWVVPIGSWLSVLDAGSFSTFKEGSYSRIQRVRGTSWSLLDSPWDGSGSGRFTVNGGRFDRSPMYSDPAPPIFPRLRSPLKLDKLAKAMALLGATFARWR